MIKVVQFFYYNDYGEFFFPLLCQLDKFPIRRSIFVHHLEALLGCARTQFTLVFRRLYLFCFH